MAIQLTPKQQECVDYQAGDLKINGVPGSGKSTVLMERAIKLNKLAIETNQPKKILVLSFNKALAKYTQETIAATKLYPCMIEISTMDKLCMSIYQNMTHSKPYMINKLEERELYINRAIQSHLTKSKKKHRFHDIDAEFWSDEFLWIKQKNITSPEQYINSERTGRGGKVRMTKDDKSVAYSLFEEYNKLLKQAHKLDWEDLYTYIIAHAESIPETAKYDFVLVDEAQDFSYARLKVAKLLCKKYITIAADKAQKIYTTSFSWKELGIDIKGKGSKTLERPFRSTVQIVQLAESLIEVTRASQEDSSEFSDALIPNREGKLPRVVRCRDASAEQSFVINLVKQHSQEKHVIGILHRTNFDRYQTSKWLSGAGISFEIIDSKHEWSIYKPGVKLSTVHSAKGLEFDTVIIPHFTKTNYPMEKLIEGAEEGQLNEIIIQERSLLYVAMTRSKNDLYLTYTGTSSPFLSEFEPEYYTYAMSTGVVLPKPKRTFSPNENEKSCFSVEADSEKTTQAAPGLVVRKYPARIQDGDYATVKSEMYNRTYSYLINSKRLRTQEAYIGKSVGDVLYMTGGDKYTIIKISRAGKIIASIDEADVVSTVSNSVSTQQTIAPKTVSSQMKQLSKQQGNRKTPTKESFPTDAMHFTFDNIKDVKRKKPYGMAIEGNVVRLPECHWSVLLDMMIPYAMEKYNLSSTDLTSSNLGFEFDSVDGTRVVPYFLAKRQRKPKGYEESYRYIQSVELSVLYGGANRCVEIMEALYCDLLEIEPNEVELFYFAK